MTEWKPIDAKAKTGRPVLLLFPEGDDVRIARAQYYGGEPSAIWLECGSMPGRSWSEREPIAYLPDPKPPATDRNGRT